MPEVPSSNDLPVRQRRAIVQAFLGSLASMGPLAGLSACSEGSDGTDTSPGTSPSPVAAPTPTTVAPTPPPSAPPAPVGDTSVPVPPPTTAQFDWGNGADAGTVAGDVWTPGRDSQGRVNLASWQAVPTGRWIEASGTRIDQSLTDQLVAAGLGWSNSAQLWGATPASSLFQTWSGFTVNQQVGRVYFFGGGHSDGYNNGLYRFDCNKMAWAIECLPSNRSQMSAAYLSNGSSTANPESMALAAANFNANNPVATSTGTLSPVQNGPFYDEIPFDNKPTARHTYQSLAFASNIGLAGSVFMGARRLWRYDIASGQWVFRRLVNDQARANAAAAPSATSIVEIHAAEAAFTAYDEVNQKLLVSASGSAGAGAYAFNWQTQSWSSWSGSYGLNFNHAAQSRVGRRWIAQSPPTSDQAVVVGRYWVYDMDSGGIGTGSLQYTGGLSLADFPSGGAFYDAEAMVYVPPLNRFWLVTRNSTGGMFWVQIDPTTTPWTASPLTFSNQSPISQRLPIGRVQWIEGLNAVLAWDHCFTGAKFYKF